MFACLLFDVSCVTVSVNVEGRTVAVSAGRLDAASGLPDEGKHRSFTVALNPSGRLPVKTPKTIGSTSDSLNGGF